MSVQETPRTEPAIPVRSDLVEANERAFGRIAAAGTWWTGTERMGLAAEARRAPDCALCRARAEALTPSAVDGEHEAAGPLPAAAVDAVHRLVTDASRLTRRWYEGLLAQGLTPGQYVEIVGVVSSVVSIDSFCRGIGAPPLPLPEPVPGEPSRYQPPGAAPEGAFVPMLARASGEEADLWSGRAGNVIRAMSLVPDAVRNLRELSAAYYVPHEQVANVRFSPRAISRAQIELVAGRVSALNECFY